MAGILVSEVGQLFFDDLLKQRRVDVALEQKAVDEESGCSGDAGGLSFLDILLNGVFVFAGVETPA